MHIYPETIILSTLFFNNYYFFFLKGEEQSIGRLVPNIFLLWTSYMIQVGTMQVLRNSLLNILEPSIDVILPLPFIFFHFDNTKRTIVLI